MLTIHTSNAQLLHFYRHRSTHCWAMDAPSAIRMTSNTIERRPSRFTQDVPRRRRVVRCEGTPVLVQPWVDNSQNFTESSPLSIRSPAGVSGARASARPTKHGILAQDRDHHIVCFDVIPIIFRGEKPVEGVGTGFSSRRA